MNYTLDSEQPSKRDCQAHLLLQNLTNITV